MNQSDRPWFSVVVPLYNKRSFIRRTVVSVLGQSFTDFELIVVDDGSTDGSYEEIRDIVDSRLRLIRQRNQGEGSARNAGMAAARGIWIAFLDADDMWFDDHLAELAAVIAQETEAGVVSTSVVEVREGTTLPIRDDVRTINKVNYFARAAKEIGFLNASSAAVHRDVFERIGGFGSFKAGADLEYWARAAIHYPVAVSNKITSVYFRGPGGMMAQIDASKMRLDMPVTQLDDISPSVAFLSRRAASEPNQWNDPSIRAYVNSRILSAIRNALYRGNINAARAASRLVLSPAPGNLLALRFMLRLPEFIIFSMLDIIRSCRRILHRI